MARAELKDQVNANRDAVSLLTPGTKFPERLSDFFVWCGDVEAFLDKLPISPIFDLVVTSPPYNIGKDYEAPLELEAYRVWQARVIEKIVCRLKDTGSVCWQVGNHLLQGKGADRGSIYPLDYLFHPIFEKNGLTLRNRIVWRFGHGLHCKHRFSGRYETVLWYTLSNRYKFFLDRVRIPSKYPGKRHYKGPNQGKYSSNPRGKNPEDVWDFPDDVWAIPNVKSRHIEKTEHPCQFPVGLVQRLLLAFTDEGDLVFDPFAGAGSTGVAAAATMRHFWGCEIVPEYARIATERINSALAGGQNFRPHDKPIYDHTQSKLSHNPFREL
jgi:adenine-specific DNA-methyltransferase